MLGIGAAVESATASTELTSAKTELNRVPVRPLRLERAPFTPDSTPCSTLDPYSDTLIGTWVIWLGAIFVEIGGVEVTETEGVDFSNPGGPINSEGVPRISDRLLPVELIVGSKVEETARTAGV